jgi:glycosyltransferase involved in cell wall biosynthesis
MKILFVSTNFPKWVGDGRGIALFQAAKALSQQGVNVKVLAVHAPGSKVYEKIGQLDIYRPRYSIIEKWESLQNGGGLPASWKKNYWSRLLFVPLVISQAIQCLKLSYWADVIHTHWNVSALGAIISNLIHRKPTILTVHGSDVYRVGELRLGRSLNRFIFKHMDKVIAVSSDLLQTAINQGLDPDKAELIPNGIDLVSFYPPKSDATRTKTILYVGSLITRKGVNYLLEAFKEVIQLESGWRLLIVGEGPEEKNLRRQCIELNISDHVEFLGAVSHNEVAKLMREVYLFVLPSNEEAFGNVVLESMASGTPVIASNVGGIPVLIKDKGGILVKPADPKSLADAINTLILDEKMWKYYSKAAVAEINSNCISWHENVKRYILIYRELID